MLDKIKSLKEQESVVLVGLINSKQNEVKCKEYLDELEFLVLTAGGISVKRFTQKLDYPNPKTFLGSGKIDQVKDYITEHEVGMVVFDDELSPSQLRNIEKILECKVLDRNNLILDIFAKRAQTSHAKSQVELAQYEYLLPRLTNMWTHLSRQKGGIGMRGPGETEIETDRRIVRDKISKLKDQLKVIDKQKSTQRKGRGQMIRVALVGYTNVGKSTIMNQISKAKVLAENKLFATLDTTVRKVVLKNLPFLLSDTVGFIRKLPLQLVESFKSTLDEVRESDLLIHVIDLSHPTFEEQIENVNDTLQELGVTDKPQILIFNKIDAYSFSPENEFDLTGNKAQTYSLIDLEKSWMSKSEHPCIFISAKDKVNFDQLRDLLYNEVKRIHIKRYPYNALLY